MIIEVGRKQAVTFALLLCLLGIVGVTAYNAGFTGTVADAENFGHTADELVIEIEGQQKTLQEAIPQLNTKGTVYTRWGRTTCPETAELVYEGYAAGGHYQHGGGSTTLCLVKDPEWAEFNDANSNHNRIWGTEYQVGNGLGGLFADYENFEAPCAVCFVEASTTLMVPGKQSCPASWDKAYEGYLMSTHSGHANSDTVCVDAAAEKLGTGTNQNGNLWYTTEAECGALPCPPYVANREVTCSVCTR